MSLKVVYFFFFIIVYMYQESCKKLHVQQEGLTLPQATLDRCHIYDVVTLTLHGHMTPPIRVRTNPQIMINLCDKINKMQKNSCASLFQLVLAMMTLCQFRIGNL